MADDQQVVCLKPIVESHKLLKGVNAIWCVIEGRIFRQRREGPIRIRLASVVMLTYISRREFLWLFHSSRIDANTKCRLTNLLPLLVSPFDG